MEIMGVSQWRTRMPIGAPTLMFRLQMSIQQRSKQAVVMATQLPDDQHQSNLYHPPLCLQIAETEATPMSSLSLQPIPMVSSSITMDSPHSDHNHRDWDQMGMADSSPTSPTVDSVPAFPPRPSHLEACPAPAPPEERLPSVQALADHQSGLTMAMAFRDSDLKALEEYHRQEEMDSDQVSDLQEEMEAMDSRLEMEAMDFRLANPVHLEDHQDLLDPCLLQPTALALSAFRGMK